MIAPSVMNIEWKSLVYMKTFHLVQSLPAAVAARCVELTDFLIYVNFREGSEDISVIAHVTFAYAE